MPKLLIVKGPRSRSEFELDEDEVFLGRDDTCQLRFELKSVSRRHAVVRRVNDHHVIMDLESRNLTYLNGRLLEAHEPVQLNDGDAIKICDFILIYQGNGDWKGALSSDSVHIIGVGEVVTPHFAVELDSSSAWDHRTLVNADGKLRALMDLTRRLIGVVDEPALIDAVLESLLWIFSRCDRAAVILFQPGADSPRVKEVKCRGDAPPDTSISQSQINYVMNMRRSVLFDSDEASGKPPAAGHGGGMLAPLLTNDGEPVGIIQVETVGRRGVLGKNDLDMLSTVALQTSQVIENARLERIRAKQEKLRGELEIARRIQFGLLPQQAPQIDGYDFFDFYSPAEQIGGDFYDYVELDNGRLAIIMADVEGHGIPAAMLISKLAGEARLQLARGVSPRELLESINSSFLSTATGKLVTMLAMILDTRTHELTLANAAHERPIFRPPSGELRELGDAEAGFQIGMLKDLDAQECRLTLEPGSLLLLYTDGITDVFDREDQMFGRARLIGELERSSHSASIFGGHAIECVQGWLAGRPQTDDMCMICIGRN